MAKGARTWEEITSQPEVWAKTLERFAADRPALEAFLAQEGLDRVLVIGCGSTHYLALSAAATIGRQAGVPARGLPASELWLFPDSIPDGRTLLLAVSRSGATTETLRALEVFREAGAGPVLGVTCYPDSPLAQRADFALVAPDAWEESVAQTRSFTSMALLTQALAAIMAQDGAALERLCRLPAALTNLMDRLGDLPERLGRDETIERIFFLGGAAFYGLACEAMLKTKEMSLSYSEAYYPLEFRHGPMSMVDRRTLVVGLLSDTGLAEELRVLRDMQGLGARTLALAEDTSAFGGRRPDEVIELHSGLSEWERGPLCLPGLQMMAYHRAVGKGLDPDEPTNLTAVVAL